MLKFPRKEERKNERKEGELKGEKGREEGKEWERKKERKVKGKNVAVYWERRRTCVKSEKRYLAYCQEEKYYFEPCILENAPSRDLQNSLKITTKFSQYLCLAAMTSTCINTCFLSRG